MADQLKLHFSASVVRSIATDLHKAWPGLDHKALVRDALRELDALELIARGTHVATVMRKHLPDDYAEAIRIVVASLGPPIGASELSGMAVFRYLPYAAFIGQYGLDHFELSMQAQHALTQRFTAEWCIRPFLEVHPSRTLARLKQWARDPNVHVRRLVSEGSRPRLPWAPQLRGFITNPAPVIALLELLKDDPERYVQRSVANNLNDIAKDHPDLVVDLARQWLRDATKGRRWIVQHGLRSLIKRGHRGALALVGAGETPRVRVDAVRLSPKRVPIGGTFAFSFRLTSASGTEQELLVDYAVHFVRANGSRRAKVFKLRRVLLDPRASVTLSGRVTFAKLTTRTPHAGRHLIEARINGITFPLGEFDVRA